MQDRNWWIGGWAERCSRCALAIEDGCSIYCSNCGKFLAQIRGTLVVPVIVSLICFAVAGLGLLVWTLGAEPQSVPDYTALLISIASMGVLALFVPVPLGRFVNRREEWEAEAQRRNEEEKERRAKEDRAERERSANAKANSGIDVRIETGDLKKAREILKGHLEEFSIGFRKPQLQRRELPVRNGPTVEVFFNKTRENILGFEDIRKNLEEVYRVKSAGIWKKVKQLARAATETLEWIEGFDNEGPPYFAAASPYHDDGIPFLFRIRRTEDCTKWRLDHDHELMRPGDKEARFGSLDAAKMACETARSEILFEELEGKKAKVTFTTLSKGLDKYTDIGCSCGRKNRVDHFRNDYKCSCGKRYVNTSEGWRPEPRCRFRLGHDGCGLRATARLHCDKTLECCRKLGNEKKFAP